MKLPMSWLLLVVVALVLSITACGEGASSVAPQSGAVLTGPLEISDKASSGTISLTVSEKGTSIASVSVTLNDLKCERFSADSFTKEVGDAFPVADGKVVASLSGIGKINGRFTSPTEASGTIDLVLEIPFGGGTCELGTRNWSVEAQPGATPRVIPTPPPVPTPGAR